MTATLLLAALAALPARAERRYRIEIAGEHVGYATLALACRPDGCRAEWASRLRAPEDTGGAILERRIEIEAAPGGEARRVRAWQRDGRGERETDESAGPVPASLAETILSTLRPGESRCLPVREEGSGRSGRACARREGAWLEGEVLGNAERFRAEPGEPPDEVVLAGQRVRFVADTAAALPSRAPRLFGVAVQAAPGGARRAARFCGRDAEPAPLPQLPPEIPLEFPEGANCREKTARWLQRAVAGAGLPGRHVVGVAFDGAAFVWHEWAEVFAGGRWVAVDPSFRQAPAEGTRFAVARFADGDRAAEAEAGAQVLACWGAGRIEGR